VNRPASFIKKVILVVFLLALGAFLWKATRTVAFGPFTLNIYSSPNVAEAGGAKWHSSGCTFTGFSDNRLNFRAWAPSFSIKADRPLKTAVHIEVANVLPAANLAMQQGGTESRNGTNRIVDIPSGTVNPRLMWNASPADSFSFSVTGDTHTDGTNLPAIAKGVDFTVIAGDLSGVDHGAQIMARYFQSLPIPVYVVPGNHDMEGVREREFVRTFSPYNYYFTYGQARFIFFDNASEILWGWGIGTSRRDWLRRQLSEASSPVTFLFMHRPPFHVMTDTEYKKPHMAGSASEGLRLINLISSGNISTVFCGHIHEYHRWERGGVPYIITGEGGGGEHGQAARYARVTVNGAKFSITDETASSDR
jgi:Icc-related predicted phosphoesterase